MGEKSILGFNYSHYYYHKIILMLD